MKFLALALLSGCLLLTACGHRANVNVPDNQIEDSRSY